MRRAVVFCSCLLFAGMCAAQDTNFSVGPQYLINGSPLLLQPIATPTLTLGAAPPAPTVSSATETSEAPSASPLSAQNRNSFAAEAKARIYWGQPEVAQPASVIEISSAELPAPLPASILDVGVSGMTDARTLRERGYGEPLGDTAAAFKAHKSRAKRVFTNADASRVHAQ